MTVQNLEKTETMPLWSIIVIGAAFVSYRLTIHFSQTARLYFEPVTRYAQTTIVANIIFAAILVVLLYSYHRWVSSINRKHELEDLVDSIGPDVLLVVDQQERIKTCNKNIFSMLGYTPREIIGRMVGTLYSLAAVPDQKVTPPSRNGRDHEFHIEKAIGKRRDGSHVHLEMIVGKLQYQPGRVILMRDVTEREEAQQEILRTKEELEQNYAKLRQLEELRDGLTHMIVHDLKSPLFGITGNLELLGMNARERLLPEDKESLEDVCNQCVGLSEMINSVLDVSRLQEKKMPLNLKTHELNELTEAGLKTAGLSRKRHNIVIEPAPEPLYAWCDGRVIQRVIGNLVGNASKYTPDEGGLIRIHMASDDDDDMVKVSVTDNGPGIPAEHLDQIFERFGQLSPTKHSTGLGLTFCKLAVEAHAGTIGVDSEVGKGSTFWFRLPQPETPAIA